MRSSSAENSSGGMSYPERHIAPTSVKPSAARCRWRSRPCAHSRPSSARRHWRASRPTSREPGEAGRLPISASMSEPLISSPLSVPLPLPYWLLRRVAISFSPSPRRRLSAGDDSVPQHVELRDRVEARYLGAFRRPARRRRSSQSLRADRGGQRVGVLRDVGRVDPVDLARAQRVIEQVLLDHRDPVAAPCGSSERGHRLLGTRPARNSGGFLAPCGETSDMAIAPSATDANFIGAILSGFSGSFHSIRN